MMKLYVVNVVEVVTLKTGVTIIINLKVNVHGTNFFLFYKLMYHNRSISNDTWMFQETHFMINNIKY